MSTRRPLVLIVVSLVVLSVVAASPIIATSVNDADDTRRSLDGASPAVADALRDAAVPESIDRRQQLQQGQSETEPNDDPSSANELSTGAQVSGALASESDSDWFAIDVSGSSTLQVDLSRPAANGVLGVAIFDPQGEFVTGSFVESESSAQVTAPAQAGRYLVLVASGSQFVDTQGDRGPAGSGPYTLGVSATGGQASPTPTTETTSTPTSTPATPTPTPATPTPSDFTTPDTTPTPSDGDGGASEVEPNDDGASANVLAPGSQVSGTVASEADLDFYAVDVSDPATLQVSLSRPAANGLLGVGVFDPQGQFVTGRFAPASDATSLSMQVSAGRHWILVASGSEFTSEGQPGPAGSGPYTLGVSTTGGEASPTPTTDATPTPTPSATPTPSDGFGTPTATPGTTTPSDGFETPTPAPRVDDESEPNDGHTQANPVRPGVTMRGTLESSDDRDWFVFDGQAGQTFNATLSRTGGDGAFRLIYYYPNGTIYEVFEDLSPTGRALLVATPPTSGSYYLRVASPNGSGPYRFTVTPLADAGAQDAGGELSASGVGPAAADSATAGGAGSQALGGTTFGDVSDVAAGANATETAAATTAADATATETAAAESTGETTAATETETAAE